MTAWGWPQWVMAAWLSLVLFWVVIRFRGNSEQLPIFLGWSGMAWVLWMGGFWS